jgi:hydroxymethylglutaryl-CoA lyase
MNLPKTAKIHEVGPRDGLQNEKTAVITADKVALVNGLAAAGLKSIEFGSFVSPKWVPQMATSDEVGAQIVRIPGVSYQGLVLNEKGYERALAAKVDSVNVVCGVSETFNRKNMNAGVEEALENYRPLLARVRQDGIPLTAYVSTAFGCPFEGAVPFANVLKVSLKFLELGANEVILSDTIGSAHPRQVRELIELHLENGIRLEQLGVHFHDTRGLALANVLAALESGVSRFDSSVGGMGGCPFAPGAQGNATTEDMVFMLEEMGVSTGVDVSALIEVARFAEKLVGRPLPGHLKNAQLKPSCLVS